MKKLNLGCWKDYKEGWVNLDVNKNQKADIYHDLNKFPYPFKDNSFDFIYISHVLEHLENPLKVLKELWRISKPNAKILIKVPHWSSYLAFGDLTHKTYFSSFSFQYFEINDSKYYCDKENFNVIKKEIKTLRNKRHKIANWISINIFEPICNINLLLTEQFLCKIFPVNEIEFLLGVIKK